MNRVETEAQAAWRRSMRKRPLYVRRAANRHGYRNGLPPEVTPLHTEAQPDPSDGPSPDRLLLSVLLTTLGREPDGKPSAVAIKMHHDLMLGRALRPFPGIDGAITLLEGLVPGLPEAFRRADEERVERAIAEGRCVRD